MPVQLNDKELPYLDKDKINAIFDCVYGIEDTGEMTKQLLQEPQFLDTVHLLLAMQKYNYQHRFLETAELFGTFESTVGPMERNSEGTTLWLSLGLAIKELYGMRLSTLKGLLEQVTIRK